jgi:Flp pilus assembly protein TadD
MGSQNFKNWIIIALFFIAFGIGIFILTRPGDLTKKTSDRDLEETLMHGPIVDPEATQVVPLDQLDVNTDDPIALASLGDRYFESNNFFQAIKIYEKVIELNPNDVDTYNDLGLALHYTGKTDSALETLIKGTEVIPSYQRIWLSLGFVLASAGRNEEARPVLKKTVELDPDSEIGQEADRMLGLLK